MRSNPPPTSFESVFPQYFLFQIHLQPYNMRFPTITAIMSLLVMAGLTVAVSHRRTATSTMIC